jgi:RNA polymerase sigma-70 factor (ECF subfamily)
MAVRTLDPVRASSSLPNSLRVLDRFGSVRAELRTRGVRLDPLPDESHDAVDNRIGTELMALYRDSQSERSFEALYAVSESSVLLWIRSLVARTGGDLDAVELLQDTFVNVFRYPRGFRESHTGSYRVWVRTIAGNIVRRARATSQRRALLSLPDGGPEPADPRATPAADVQALEQMRGLQGAWTLFLLHYARAWERLRPRDRLALRLVEVEGRSYAEAGRILDVGRSNMKMIVFRARKRIAQRMAEVMHVAAPAGRRRAG